MKMVENAQNSRAPIQTFADQLSGVFVPAIVVLAILTWIVWFSLVYSSEIDTGDETRFQFAFDFGISTLVIACPCALGLATPTAVMVGTGLAASYGILIKSADVLEKIGKISTIVFDKTGTLTAGEPKVVHMIQCKQAFKIEAAMDDEQLLQQVLYLAESSSEHPIAKAICAHIKDMQPDIMTNSTFNSSKFDNKDGEGILATISDETRTLYVQCGNKKLFKDSSLMSEYPNFDKNIAQLEQEGKTVVALVIDDVPQLLIGLEE
jgi:P-type Cu+ transporter